MSNSSRERILSSIRANIPPKLVRRPPSPVFNRSDVDLKSSFERRLEEAGGAAHEIGSRQEAEAKLASLHPKAQVICSAVPEICRHATRRDGSRSARTRGCRCRRGARSLELPRVGRSGLRRRT
jgi:hypothetical protein